MGITSATTETALTKRVRRTYCESAALSMSWNKQSRPTMGQSWPELSLLSPTDRQSVEVARRETRRQIILEDIFLFSSNINCSDSSHFVSTSISVFLSYQLFLGIMCQFWMFQSEDLVARLGEEWKF